MERIYIAEQTELSTTPHSLVKTNAVNKQEYLVPGANGAILTLVAGVPTWQAPVIPSEYEQAASFATLPVVGVADTLYYAALENAFYIWNGAAYVQVPTAATFSFIVNGTGVGTVAQTISNADTLTIRGATNSGIRTLGVATDGLEISLNEVKETFAVVAAGNTVTASQTPIASTLDVYRNGMLQRLTTDYSLAASVITFTTSFGASSGATFSESITIKYRAA